MKQETATLVADLVLFAAAGAATWLILRDERIRRPALRLLWQAATVGLPAYLAKEVRTAWAESDQRKQRSMIAV